MKLSIKLLKEIIPVSSHTIRRLMLCEDFPEAKKIGREYYFNDAAFYEWLSGRASNPDAVQHDDVIADVPAACALVGRSKAWIWDQVSSKGFTSINLSPDADSKNLRRYFIEREIREAFPELINLVGEAS